MYRVRLVTLFIAANLLQGSYLCAVQSLKPLSSAQPEMTFFDLVRATQPTQRKFVPESAPRWDIAKLSSWISPEGLILVEANSKKGMHHSFKEVSNALAARKGPVFLLFAHMSFLLGHRLPQYSKLWFEGRQAARVGCIATFYEVTFLQGGNGPKVVKIENINQGE